MDFGKPRTPSRRSGVLGQRHRTGELREVERYVREADQAKMATLMGHLSTFFGSQTPATFTPDPAVMAAYGVTARQYPKTASGTWVINPPPAVPKFGFA